MPMVTIQISAIESTRRGMRELGGSVCYDPRWNIETLITLLNNAIADIHDRSPTARITQFTLVENNAPNRTPQHFNGVPLEYIADLSAPRSYVDLGPITGQTATREADAALEAFRFAYNGPAPEDILHSGVGISERGGENPDLRQVGDGQNNTRFDGTQPGIHWAGRRGPEDHPPQDGQAAADGAERERLSRFARCLEAAYAVADQVVDRDRYNY